VSMLHLVEKRWRKS